MNLSDEASTVSKNGRCSIEFNRMIILTVRIFNSAVILNESKSFELPTSKLFETFQSFLKFKTFIGVTLSGYSSKQKRKVPMKLHRRNAQERKCRESGLRTFAGHTASEEADLLNCRNRTARVPPVSHKEREKAKGKRRPASYLSDRHRCDSPRMRPHGDSINTPHRNLLISPIVELVHLTFTLNRA